MYVIRINLGSCHTLFMWTISKYDGNIFTISLILLLHQKVMQYQKYIIKQKWWFYIVWTPIPPFKKGGINFNHLPWRGGGESEKRKKGVEVWCRGRRQFFQCLSLLCLEITLLKTLFFSANIILWKKIKRSCYLKMNLKTSHN